MTFAQAADELGVTPSAVSHQIQLLETCLGVRLFLREAGRATLTAAGRTYAQEVTNAFALIAKATDLVAPQPLGRHLVIASSPSFAAKWLQPRLAAFLGGHPGIKVRLSTLSTRDTLDDQPFDIAIVYGRPLVTRGQSEALLVEKLRPLCSPALVAALDLRVPCDLSRATLIHSVNALTWSEYLSHVGAGDVRPDNELWINPSSIAIDAAVAGVGVVLESELLAEREIRDGRLVAPFDSERFRVETRSYFLVRPARSRSGSQVAAFEQWLRSSIAAASDDDA